jgi:hypothetical protein
MEKENENRKVNGRGASSRKVKGEQLPNSLVLSSWLLAESQELLSIVAKGLGSYCSAIPSKDMPSTNHSLTKHFSPSGDNIYDYRDLRDKNVIMVTDRYKTPV